MSRGRDLKDKVEWATAQNFVQWYNAINGRNLTFSERPHEAPDFRFCDSEGAVVLEITTVSYDQTHAKYTYEIARGRRKAYSIHDVVGGKQPIEFHSVPCAESKLVTSINGQLARKCANNYGSDCILVARIVGAALTTEFFLQHQVVPHVAVGERNPFMEIYLTMNQTDYFAVSGP